MKTALAALLLAVVVTVAQAAEVRVGDLVIEAPWSRATPAGAGVGAGYMVIRNEGTVADRLVGGAAPFAGRVEIHEMAMQEGVMRMRPLADGLAIPAGGSVTLEPGGYHVMFMQLTEPLVEGERRRASLAFEHAGEVEVELEVRSMAAGH